MASEPSDKKAAPVGADPTTAERTAPNVGANLSDVTKLQKPLPAPKPAPREETKLQKPAPNRPGPTPSGKILAPPPLPGAKPKDLDAKLPSPPPIKTEPKPTPPTQTEPKASPSLPPEPAAKATPPEEKAAPKKGLPPLPKASPSGSSVAPPKPAEKPPAAPKPQGKPSGESFVVSPGVELGEYKLIEPIAQGAMGEVWRARNTKIGKWAAIKIPIVDLATRKDAADRFLQEARAVNEIRHRNIVDIFDFGQLPDGRPYYVMELLEGQPLSEYLRDRGPLPFMEILEIFGPACQALQAAHDQGIIHRDLKSDNIFLVLDKKNPPFVKVLDFGIAKLKGGLASDTKEKLIPGAVYGTPEYMSPEQCQGADGVDHRADIYSLAVVLYEMITGRLPFHDASGNTSMLLVKHITDTPQPPSRAVSGRGIPEEVDALVLQALAKDPSQRPQSCEAFYEALVRGVGILRFEEQDAILGAKALFEVPPAVKASPQETPKEIAKEAPKEIVKEAPKAPPKEEPKAAEPVKSQAPEAKAQALSYQDSPTEQRPKELPPEIQFAPDLKPFVVDPQTAAAMVEEATNRAAAAGQNRIPTGVITIRPKPAPKTTWPIFMLGGAAVTALVLWLFWPAPPSLAPAPKTSIDAKVSQLVPTPPETRPILVASSEPTPKEEPASNPGAPTSAVTETKIALALASEPNDAEVFLDDVLLGTTPLQLEIPLSEKEAVLRFTKSGFEPFEERFTPNKAYESQPRLTPKEEKITAKEPKIKPKPKSTRPKDPKVTTNDKEVTGGNPFKKKPK